MFDRILAAEIRDRSLIEIPQPHPAVDKKGNPVLRDGRPQFNVAADQMDYEIGKQSRVRIVFSQRFIINAEHRAKPTELAVFFFLANTTEWSRVKILVDGDNKPVLNSAGKGQAVITTYGNRGATRTLNEIADATNASYGAVQKALAFWEGASVMSRIREYRRKHVKPTDEAGRPVEHRRYEFNPQYVWNGHIWIGNGYSDFLQGSIEVVG